MPHDERVHAPGNWIVVGDACAGCKSKSTWGPFVVSYRIHVDTTSDAPEFEGAWLTAQTGVNRAETLAVLSGLHTLMVGIKGDEWAPRPVLVVTDSQFVINTATGRWRAQKLAGLYTELESVCEQLANLTGRDVRFKKGEKKQVRETDNLGRAFLERCADQRHRRAWARSVVRRPRGISG